MTWQTRLGMVFAAVVAITACERSATTKEAAAAEQIQPGLSPEPVKAQPKLRTIKLWLGGEELLAELALSFDEVRTGMMFRTEMAESEAMLFVFARPHQAAFWMKNTIVPLSAAYIDPDGVILEIHDLKPHDTNSVYAKTDRVQYVLETRQGWFERHKVGVGTIVRTERGSLRESFTFRK